MLNFFYKSLGVVALLAVIAGCKDKNVKHNYPQKNQKVIGIIPGYDLDTKKPADERKYFNYHMLRDRYIDGFENICKDTTFVIMPILEKDSEKLFQLVDGIIISGGDDINPKYFKQKKHEKVTSVEPDRRTNFQLAAINYAIKNGKPLLGICNGMQGLNIAMGGDLIQDIPSELEKSEKHKGENPRKTMHGTTVVRDTWLYNVVGVDSMTVNSNHHQAVGKIGKNLVISAKASDGIVEAIECTNCKKPVIGVQWHPEYAISANDRKIIKAFCDAVEKE